MAEKTITVQLTEKQILSLISLCEYSIELATDRIIPVDIGGSSEANEKLAINIANKKEISEMLQDTLQNALENALTDN
jgi:hypothetical protein